MNVYHLKPDLSATKIRFFGVGWLNITFINRKQKRRKLK